MNECMNEALKMSFVIPAVSFGSARTSTAQRKPLHANKRARHQKSLKISETVKIS